MEPEHKEKAGWVNDNFLTIMAFIWDLRQGLEFLRYIGSWNYFYLVFYRRKKSRSVLINSEIWVQQHSAKPSDHQNLSSPSRQGLVSYRVGKKETVPLVYGLGLQGPHCTHQPINIYRALWCSRYGVRCWAHNEDSRVSSNLLEHIISWKTGAEANDIHVTWQV